MKPIAWSGVVELDRVKTRVELTLRADGGLALRVDGAGPKDGRARVDAERQVLRHLLSGAAHVLGVANACRFALTRADAPLAGAIAFLREAWRNDGAEGESVHLLCNAAERHQDWIGKLLRAICEEPEQVSLPEQTVAPGAPPVILPAFGTRHPALVELHPGVLARPILEEDGRARTSILGLQFSPGAGIPWDVHKHHEVIHAHGPLFVESRAHRFLLCATRMPTQNRASVDRDVVQTADAIIEIPSGTEHRVTAPKVGKGVYAYSIAVPSSDSL